MIVVAIACSFSSCSDDDTDPIIENKELAVPSQIQVIVEQNNGIAKIAGVADPNIDIHIKYNDANGAVLKNARTTSSGSFSFQVDLFFGYAQQLVVYTSVENGDITKSSKESEKISVPAKDASLELTNDQIKEKLIANRWKSDQTVSRVIIRQTAVTPPYDMFATVAQKFFVFKASGELHFEVTTPVQFTHTSGSWSIDNNGIATINTVIPLGPMQITNAKIQQLDANRLTLLANISDGLFLLSFVKE